MIALWLILAAAAIVAAAVYGVSLRLHPWHPCGRCSGSGRITDPIWKRSYGSCPRCGGRGRHPRLGVRVFTPSRARRLTRGQPSRKSVDGR